MRAVFTEKDYYFSPENDHPRAEAVEDFWQGEFEEGTIAQKCNELQGEAEFLLCSNSSEMDKHEYAVHMAICIDNLPESKSIIAELMAMNGKKG